MRNPPLHPEAPRFTLEICLTNKLNGRSHVRRYLGAIRYANLKQLVIRWDRLAIGLLLSTSAHGNCVKNSEEDGGWQGGRVSGGEGCRFKVEGCRGGGGRRAV